MLFTANANLKNVKYENVFKMKKIPYPPFYELNMFQVKYKKDTKIS
jgi:hypothetical protein